ncbi:molecular chaperone [Paraburkholderia sp. BL10I2N1]|uniref:fimbrial biogenesis chaperone n=1 Tax=Paraburkholderia sp. BL10I2N1 TaxID=1938796 RepID=UPI001061BA2F|nr:molecular chaperone [Paraburkholderia sp. BL10I2N1]TDN61352.1 fimbrial chaperone protein [Paraburkholderia sp. BL10I2N1]
MGWVRENVYRVMLAATCAAQIGSACASVIMPGTRVIYDGNAREQSLQFTNQDDGPSVMQVWVDSGNAQSTPDTADAPFLVTPPIFRIEPKAGQTVRLVFTGKDLPQDRESVFYLNTLQIPSKNAAYADQNQMLVMLRNRLKLFYRPAGIEGSAQKAQQQLTFRIGKQDKSERVTANNSSGYYISLLDGSVTCGTHTATFTADMLAPHSEAGWSVKGECPLEGATPSLKIKYVDDYGAVRESEYAVVVEQGMK